MKTTLQVEDPTVKFIKHLKDTNQSHIELVKLKPYKNSFIGAIEIENYNPALLKKPLLIGNRMNYINS